MENKQDSQDKIEFSDKDSYMHDHKNYTIPMYILDNILQILFKCDTDGNILYLNRFGQKVTGCTAADLADGLNIADFLITEDLESFKSNLSELIEKGTCKSNLYTIKTRSGNIHHLKLYSNVLIDNKIPKEIIGLAIDITDIKNVNKQLMQSEEFNRILLESNPIPTLMHSSNIIHYINDAGMKLLDVDKADEIIGKKIQDIIHPDSFDFVLGRIEKCSSSGIVNKPMEQKLLSIKKKVIYVKTTAIPTTYYGNPAVMALIEDISDTKQIEHAKTEKIKFLDSLNKIDLILRSPESLTQVLNDILESCLEIFETDRAWLLYPCDPDTETWSVPMEKYRPEYPGLLNKQTPESSSKQFRSLAVQLLETNSPQYFDLENDYEEFSSMADIYNLKSLIQIAIRPRIGKPWIFGMHQCSYVRQWSESDINLFKEVAQRLTEGLSSLIYFDNMRKNEENLSVTLRSIGDGVISTDSDGKVNRMNIVAEQLTGWKEAEAKGKELSEVFQIISSITGKKVENPVKQVLSEGATKGLANHTVLISKDGIKRQIADSAAPILDDNHNIMGVVLVFRDVTETYQKAQQLRESEENLKFIIDQMPISLLITDREGKPLKVNESFLKTYNIKKPEEFLKHFNLFSDSLLADLGVKNIREQIYRGNEIQLSDLYLSPRKLFRWGDGEIKKDMLINLTIFPVKHSEQEINHIVLSCKNVTDERRIERELRRLDKMESVGVLAGGIAHDFNNILTALGSNISLALEYCEDKDSRLGRILTNTQQATQHATALANQLLTFASGGTPVKETLNLKDSIVDSIKFALRGSKVKSSYEIDEDVKNVDMDIHQINQVINNLIRNAIEAMPDGGEIAVKLCNFTNNMTVPGLGINTDYILLSISDSGVGIDIKDQEQIFDLFFTTKKKGKGIGLSTAYSIIKKHSGVINFTSKSGKGTTFNIYLPISNKAEVRKMQTTKIAKGQGRILVMDDEEIIRQSVLDLLEYLGFEAETASYSEETIDKYKTALEENKRFDAVILDLTIPGGPGGEEVLNSLMEIDPNVIGIVSSGYSDDKILSNYSAYGFKGVLPKPFDINIISDVITSVLSKK